MGSVISADTLAVAIAPDAKLDTPLALRQPLASPVKAVRSLLQVLLMSHKAVRFLERLRRRWRAVFRRAHLCRSVKTAESGISKSVGFSEAYCCFRRWVFHCCG